MSWGTWAAALCVVASLCTFVIALYGHWTFRWQRVRTWGRWTELSAAGLIISSGLYAWAWLFEHMP